jgi:hypothetical protein
MTGDPGRSTTRSRIKGLSWQTGLLPLVEPKWLFDALANQYAAPIVQRDDGMFQIGLADGAPGPFETRSLAAAVAATEAAHGAP